MLLGNPIKINMFKLNSIKLLGFILLSSLNCKDHIKSKCGIAVCNIHRIRKISRYLSLESGKILASALVLAHFDHGNSLFHYSSLRPMLPVCERCEFKIMLIIPYHCATCCRTSACDTLA